LADVAVAEGNSAVSFTISLSAASSQPVTVAYATAHGTATAGSDYTAAAGTLTFAPGQASKAVTISMLGDILDEADETFFVNLTGPTNATLLDAHGVATILDDDPLPALSVSVGPSLLEHDTAGLTADLTLTLTLAPASGRSVGVAYASADQTAHAGSDYIATSGVLTFAPGHASKSISVPISGDLVPEPTESFTVSLSAVPNATLGGSTSTGSYLKGVWCGAVAGDRPISRRPLP
jgi:hypothetical protein